MKRQREAEAGTWETTGPKWRSKERWAVERSSHDGGQAGSKVGGQHHLAVTEPAGDHRGYGWVAGHPVVTDRGQAGRDRKGLEIEHLGRDRA